MTDAELPAASLRPMLKRVVDRTFNAMSIDTDTVQRHRCPDGERPCRPVNPREFERAP
jgi:hypothetical protein